MGKIARDPDMRPGGKCWVTVMTKKKVIEDGEELAAPKYHNILGRGDIAKAIMEGKKGDTVVLSGTPDYYKDIAYKKNDRGEFKKIGISVFFIDTEKFEIV
ncbi:MAG: hypothetical protein SVK08_00170 [Halobacteriota archaeon]|nr:hypothetical protein [Halobacteriota archaeon]